MRKYWTVIIRLNFFLLLVWNGSSYSSELKPPSNGRLNIGVYRPSLNNYVDLTDIEVSFNYWLKEVTRDLSLQSTETYFFDKYQDLSNAFSRGDIDLFIAPPLAIVMYFNKELIGEGFYSQGENGEGDALLLLARSKVVDSLDQMAGKKLVLPANDKLAEFFMETIAFETTNKPYNKVFSRIETASKMNRIVLSLFFGHADVAIVYKSSYDVMVEMNSQIQSRIKILKSYPVLSKNMTFMRKNYPNRRWILAKIQDFADHPRGKQILNMFQCPSVRIATVEVLEPFELFYQNYLSLKNLKLIDKMQDAL